MVTFHFVPYHQLEDADSEERIDFLLDIVKKDKIVMLEGQLAPEEEADLIEQTMEQISGDFKGIEIAVVHPEKEKYDGLQKLKFVVTSMLLGDRQGFTVIGPASIVKKIKQDPNALELYTQEAKKKRKKKKSKKKKK